MCARTAPQKAQNHLTLHCVSCKALYKNVVKIACSMTSPTLHLIHFSVKNLTQNFILDAFRIKGVVMWARCNLNFITVNVCRVAKHFIYLSHGKNSRGLSCVSINRVTPKNFCHESVSCRGSSSIHFASLFVNLLTDFHLIELVVSQDGLKFAKLLDRLN